MIDISVELIENGKEGVKLNCNGSVRGNGDDLRREMVGVLLMFDEIASGKILCDAFEEFLHEKFARKLGKRKDENENDNNA